jgi:hypothetical protein
MIKLYVYSTAQPQLHEAIAGFEDTVPFSAVGRAKHCTIVTDPAEADYFYMGQVADKDAWQLHPNRFPYYTAYQDAPRRHIVDLEGDWRDFDHPAWLQQAIITTGHARLLSQPHFKRRLVRPVISPMLMRLLREAPPYSNTEQRGFWFQGQPDFTHKVREKVAEALKRAAVPGEWVWVQGWSLYKDEQDPAVQSFLTSAQKWSYALCPIGEGPSARLYETVLLGRVPVLIGDYVPALNYELDHHFSAQADVELLASSLRLIYHSDQYEDALTHALGYADLLRLYFKDPTAYLLEWLDD